MEDLGLPLLLFLGGLTNLTVAFPLGRFHRPVAAAAVIATFVWGGLWLSHALFGTAMVPAVPIPFFVALLLVVAAMAMHLAVYIRSDAARLRAKKAAQQP